MSIKKTLDRMIKAARPDIEKEEYTNSMLDKIDKLNATLDAVYAVELGITKLGEPIPDDVLEKEAKIYSEIKDIKIWLFDYNRDRLDTRPKKRGE